MDGLSASLVNFQESLNKEKNVDSGAEIDLEGDIAKIKVKIDHDDPMQTAIIKPNLDSIRKILGGDGTDQQRKVVEDNTGLIPKYYKPYRLLESTESGKPVSLYKCDFCQQVYRGHNSIVYHCRRHIGDYPYRCEDCGFVEVCKSGLSSHMNRTGHGNCRKIDAQPSPGQNGTKSLLNSTQIFRKAKKVEAFERVGKQFARGKRANAEPADIDEHFTSPTKKTKQENDEKNSDWNTKVINSFSDKNLADLSDNFKLSETLRKLHEINEKNQSSFCFIGGKGVNGNPNKEAPDDSCIFVDSFESDKKRESVNFPQKPNGKVRSEDDSFLMVKSKKTKFCEEAMDWRFCKDCQTAWFKSEKIFINHACFM